MVEAVPELWHCRCFTFALRVPGVRVDETARARAPRGEHLGVRARLCVRASVRALLTCGCVRARARVCLCGCVRWDTLAAVGTMSEADLVELGVKVPQRAGRGVVAREATRHAPQPPVWLGLGRMAPRP